MNRRMRILLISNGTRNVGGWYTYTKDLSVQLRNMGHTVWCPSFIAPLLQLTNPLASATTTLASFFLIATMRPDVVHITVEPYINAFRWLPLCVLRKTILTIHGSYGVRILEDGYQQKYILKSLLQIKAIITVSEYTKNQFLHTLQKVSTLEIVSAIAKKICVIPNGIFLPKKPVRKSGNTMRSILCIGGVKPRKNIIASLEAIALYRNTYGKTIHFSIAGETRDARYLEEVYEAIHTLDLAECTTVCGKVSPGVLEQLFSQADLYLMPTKTTHDTFEGFGLVYLEANARCIPVIGPNQSGATEAIAEGESGYRVDPTNTEEIVDRMHWILDERKISADQCRKWAEHHDVKRMTESTCRVYDLVSSH